MVRPLHLREYFKASFTLKNLLSVLGYHLCILQETFFYAPSHGFVNCHVQDEVLGGRWFDQNCIKSKIARVKIRILKGFGGNYHIPLPPLLEEKQGLFFGIGWFVAGTKPRKDDY
jgi:hypothetical protein